MFQGARNILYLIWQCTQVGCQLKIFIKLSTSRWVYFMENMSYFNKTKIETEKKPNGNPVFCSGPWIEEPGKLYPWGSERRRHNWSNWNNTCAARMENHCFVASSLKTAFQQIGHALLYNEIILCTSFSRRAFFIQSQWNLSSCLY